MADTEGPSAGSAWYELRRRKVVQWSLAYVAAAWGLVQGIQFAVDTFGWPGTFTRIAAVLAVASLPIVVALAWYHGDRGEQRVRRSEVVVLALLLALAGVAVVREARIEPQASGATSVAANSTRPAAVADRRRIAILPFDNLGSLASNAAFVGGVHDTLITQVAKIPGLSVISRSSVLQFAGKHPTMQQVAAALGVGAVLEGSVEREGDRLRIQAQLIDARTDAHLWAETYDRRTDDLFAVQSDIAQAVAEQLRIHLTGAEGRRLRQPMTTIPKAYEHYVLGRHYLAEGDWSDAIRELTRSVGLDSQFAAAYAARSMARTWLGFLDPRTRAENLPLARADTDKALSLNPALPEAHLAEAVYLYRGEPDIERAAAEFERAIRDLPSDALALVNFSYLRRWQGRWDDADALLARAAELDPLGAAPKQRVLSLVWLGRRDEAARALAAAESARPDDVELALWPGELVRNFSCDLGTTERVFREVSARFPESQLALVARLQLAVQTGDVDTARKMLERLPAFLTDPDPEATWVLASGYRLAGKRDESNAILRRYVRTFQDEMRDIPAAEQDPTALAWVAADLAALGDRNQAQVYRSMALAAMPPTGDEGNRGDVYHLLAVSLAWAHEPQAANAYVSRLLDRTYWAKPAYLWCDPYLAPLRSDPAFRELLAAHGAPVDVDPLRRSTWPTQ